MPTEWKLQDRITANDLGNGKFLFTFESEEDLQYILQQGPFHYNFCMFVLVRWEPIIHDDYAWIIPLWVEITGIPLHLWTSTNLKKIGSNLGYIDEHKIKESEGRMSIDVDTRKPLVFHKKILSPDGDEVSIQMKYDKLFKHCTSCGLLSHELSHCPKKEQGSSVQMERADVFSRVQIPMGESARQPLLRDQTTRDQVVRYDHQDRTYHRNVDPHSSQRRSEEEGYSRSVYARKDVSSVWYVGKQGGKERRYKPDSSCYGSRYAPYDKNKNKSWRPKDKVETQREIVVGDREPYAPKSLQLRSGSSSTIPMEIPAEIEHHNTSGNKIESVIITPSRQLMEQDDNVTKRSNINARSITFSPTEEELPYNAQMIEALSEMEIVQDNKNDDGKEALMDCHVDDLLGRDLMDLEDGVMHSVRVADTVSIDLSRKERARGSSSTKGERRSGIPLGLPNKKAEFLRRGSPKHRPSSSKRFDRSTHHRHSSKASRSSSSKVNVLEGSKNTTRHYP